MVSDNMQKKSRLIGLVWRNTELLFQSTRSPGSTELCRGLANCRGSWNESRNYCHCTSSTGPSILSAPDLPLPPFQERSSPFPSL